MEMAILMPAILLALFASIQVAAWFLARSVALTAAQEATTAERAYNAAPGSGQARAHAFLARSGDWLTAPSVTVIRSGDQVESTVRGSAVSLIPGVRIAVVQTARGERERVTTLDRP